VPQLTDLTDIGELTKEVTNFARDAAYVVVGLGVLGVQRAQVQRVELQNRLTKDLSVDGRLSEVRQGVTRQAKTIDEMVESAVKFIETTLQPLEEQLPGATRDIAKRAHEQAREVRGKIRSLVVPAA
jgi:hypothetical protein